jgi:hypothetical protein
LPPLLCEHPEPAGTPRDSIGATMSGEITMNETIFARASRYAVDRAVRWSVYVLVLTVIHHAYGAYLFRYAFMLHVTVIAIPVGALIVGFGAYARRAASRPAASIASATALILMVGISILAIGFYEGGYNHLLPNIQYALGIRPTLRAGLYEPPDDLIFQANGVAQFFVALVALYFTITMFRSARQPREQLPSGGTSVTFRP